MEEKTVPVLRVPKCAYLKCYGEGKIAVSGQPFCRKHAEWADFFLWIATQIRMKEENVTKSGLIIPK